MGPINFMSKSFKAAGAAADLGFELANTGIEAVKAASKNVVVDTALVSDSIHQVVTVCASQAYAWRVKSNAKLAAKKPNLAKLVNSHLEAITGEKAIEYTLEKKAKPEKAVAPVSEKKEEVKAS